MDAVVLAADGRCSPDRAELAEPARALLAAAPDAADVEVSTAQGSVFAARSDAHAVVLVCGRFALPALVRFDLRMVLGDLAGAERRRVRRPRDASAGRRVSASLARRRARPGAARGGARRSRAICARSPRGPRRASACSRPPKA